MTVKASQGQTEGEMKLRSEQSPGRPVTKAAASTVLRACLRAAGWGLETWEGALGGMLFLVRASNPSILHQELSFYMEK